MNQFEEIPIAYLKLQLKSKAFLKQKVWTLVQNFYSVLKSEAAKIISELKKDHWYPDGFKEETGA